MWFVKVSFKVKWVGNMQNISSFSLFFNNYKDPSEIFNGMTSLTYLILISLALIATIRPTSSLMMSVSLAASRQNSCLFVHEDTVSITSALNTKQR